MDDYIYKIVNPSICLHFSHVTFVVVVAILGIYPITSNYESLLSEMQKLHPKISHLKQIGRFNT